MNFETKIATKDELIEKWDFEINNHPNDNRWKIWKDIAVENAVNGNRLCFLCVLNGVIIAETTAIISKDDTGLGNRTFVADNTAYLEAFRVNKEFRGKGYFSKLYRFMENFLISEGFSKFILGVEPNETKNLEIYKHLGFDKLIAKQIEKYPPQRDGEECEEYLVHYYLKEI